MEYRGFARIEETVAQRTKERESTEEPNREFEGYRDPCVCRMQTQAISHVLQ